MGLNFLKRSCSSSPYAVPDSNPNPRNFKILTEEYIRGFLVLTVQYPNCTNYEGKKLMVYSGFKTSKELIAYNKGELDPHFANTIGSPIARFRPSEDSLPIIEAMIHALQI